MINFLKRIFLPFEFEDHPLYYDKEAALKQEQEDQELDDLINEVL